MEKHKHRQRWYLWFLVIAALLGILGLYLLRTRSGQELQYGALIFKTQAMEKACDLLHGSRS